MADILNLAQAKEFLRIDDTFSDDLITNVLIPAVTDIIASYLKWPSPTPYDGVATPYPARVTSAAYCVLAAMYEDREGANDPIGPAVVSILARDRDPALV